MLSGLAEKASSLTCTLDPEALRSGKELMNTAQGLAKDMDVVSNVAKQFCKSVDNWLGNLMVISFEFLLSQKSIADIDPAQLHNHLKLLEDLETLVRDWSDNVKPAILRNQGDQCLTLKWVIAVVADFLKVKEEADKSESIPAKIALASQVALSLQHARWSRVRVSLNANSASSIFNLGWVQGLFSCILAVSANSVFNFSMSF